MGKMTKFITREIFELLDERRQQHPERAKH